MQSEREAPLPADRPADADVSPPYAHPWRAFLVLAVAIFLTVLDLFVVNVALPAVAADFPEASLASLSWILTGYAIVFAAVLVPAGKLGDLYGRRRLFSIGLLLFVVGSAIAALAGSLEILIAARGVQAVGAAAVTPNSLGLALTLFPPQRRAGVIAAWGAIAGLGAAAGPAAGALLAQADWRWIFLINLPVGIAALILVPRLVREVRDAAADRLPDGLGAIVLAVAIGVLVLGLSRGPDWGWGDARVLGSFATAGVLGVAFVRRSASHPAPIVELSMFRVRSFAHAMVATVLLWAGFAAILVSSALFLTATWGFSVLETGFALAPGPAVSAPAAALSGRLGARFGPERVGGVGAALFATGGLWLAGLLGDEVSYATAFLPAQLLVGVGVGLTIPTLVAIALAEIPPTRFSTGTAVYATFRQIGTALGVAVWLAVLGTASITNASSFTSGWVVITAIAAATSVAVLSTPRRASAESPPTPGEAAVVTTGGYGEERLSESAGSSVSIDRTA
jgi:EmrB/QacA subfamily drug resistance transporter